MVVIPSVPAKTVLELIAYAKANPGKVNMGSAGTGSVTHLAGELFKMMAGVNLVHVPFRGNGPALTAMLGGQVEVQFPSVASSLEYIRTGKLRGLAISGAMHSAVLLRPKRGHSVTSVLRMRPDGRCGVRIEHIESALPPSGHAGWSHVLGVHLIRARRQRRRTSALPNHGITA